MLQLLLVSTAADLSIPLFFKNHPKNLIEPQVINYPAFEKKVNNLKAEFDFIYFRDPFNDKATPPQQARAVTSNLVAKYKTAYSVDGITSFEDMLFEDKWNQYKTFGHLVPPTEILKTFNAPSPTKFIKKRISARSKGIIFTKNDFPANARPTDYIVQPKLDIDVEYRVYMLGGDIVEPLAIKSSKSRGSRVRLIGVEKTVEPEIIQICQTVYQKTQYDLMGLDIAKTAGGFVLLEVNRSPQFDSYFKLSSINLAAKLNKYLVTKIYRN